MTSKVLLASLLAVGLLGCAGGQGRPVSQDEPVGVLALNLTGTDNQGVQYRLRNAEFDIGGYYYYPYPQQAPTPVSVSSETDPEADTIDTTLVPGSYTVTLSNHLWYLEKLTDQGFEHVDQAVLLSPESQYAYVYEGSTSSVYFAFGVDGQLIDFHHGVLQIGITVQHPGDEDGGIAPPPPPPPPVDQDGGAL